MDLAAYTLQEESLLLLELVRWSHYNEYEGHCIASWHGRQDCFYLQLQPDEWETLQPGMRWHAPVVLQRFGKVQHGPEIERQPALTQLKGVNYRVNGEVWVQEGEFILMAMPWGPLRVDLDQPFPADVTGQWLRLEGVLQAQWPDSILNSDKRMST